MMDDSLLRVAHIPAGEFMMGADDAEEHERPAHRAYLDEFYIGVYAVTNDEYARFVREAGHPSPAVRELPLVVPHGQEGAFRETAVPYVWRDGQPPPGRGQHPVTLVTIEDAMAYCVWLGSKTGKPVRLPTEAEWERGARGSLVQSQYPWGNNIDPSHANFLHDPALKNSRGTEPVGCYSPNAFELFDTIGNVWEWVSDWYGSDYYAKSQYLNPQGPESGRLRIIRGGGWVTSQITFLRCSHRHQVPEDTYSYSIGFRIACSARRQDA
jgi:sulfatase modifying factor 1